MTAVTILIAFVPWVVYVVPYFVGLYTPPM
jgi:hypothetical protein